MSDNVRVDFDALKARADFRAVLSHYGIKLPGRGMQVKICCPFHDDAEPSCSINLERGIFHCFGAGCGVEGNVLDFVHRMETQNGAAASIRTSALRIAEICGIPLDDIRAQKVARKPREGRKASGAGKPLPSSTKAAPGPPARPQEAVPEEPRSNRPLGFALKLDPGHSYLVERNIPPSIVERFGLGFCSRGTMAGRICIPIRNVAGELVAYAGRWAGRAEDLPEGEDKYKLPSGFLKTLELFNLHRVRQCRHLVVVEGYFGTMRLDHERIPAVALMGSSLDEAQIALLYEHCPSLEALTVMLDGGEAASKAADVVASQLARHWWVRSAELTDGEQPDTVPLDDLHRLLRRGKP